MAIYVDASSGTGWWYEGGGLLRHNFLVRANPIHLNPTGSAWVHVDNITDGAATFVAAAEVDNDSKDVSLVTVHATLRDTDDKVIATGTSSPTSIAAGSTRNELPEVRMHVSAGVQSWSVQSPYLYKVEIALQLDGKNIDAVNVTAGVRTIRWNADHGLFLNQEHVKLRGFL